MEAYTTHASWQLINIASPVFILPSSCWTLRPPMLPSSHPTTTQSLQGSFLRTIDSIHRLGAFKKEEKETASWAHFPPYFVHLNAIIDRWHQFVSIKVSNKTTRVMQLTSRFITWRLTIVPVWADRGRFACQSPWSGSCTNTCRQYPITICKLC